MKGTTLCPSRALWLYYYLPVTEAIYFDIGFTLQLNEERVKEIVGYCVKIRLFDGKTFKFKWIIAFVDIQ